MKIALIQTNPQIGNFAANTDKIIVMALQAREAGCDLAIFPELAVSGYPPLDLLERPSFIDDHDRACAKLLAKIRGIAVLCGAITRHHGPTGKLLHNSGLLFEDGQVLCTIHKQLLPNYDVFDEVRYFEPATGNLPCNYKGVKLGITICEDIWNDKDVSARQIYNLDPMAELCQSGEIDLLINIAASPYRIGKRAKKKRIFTTLCRKYKKPMIYVNQVGGQDSLLFDGRSLVMSAAGEIVVQGPDFTEGMVIFDTAADYQPLPASSATIDETAEVLDALTMGVRDYVHKCGFTKGLIGLSGGIDSALTAVIAARALGPENIMGVALPSPYSSPGSVEDAGLLAKNLNIRFEILPIHEIFSNYQQTLAPLFSDLKTDVTEQNIQARIRGNLLMALSNKFGHMLLSTGNKSEMAVGYCTLYGDMSGGLAVIADVPKVLVYRLARLINQENEIIPWRTIDKPPSAELAPNQRDQDDLPPYEILDPILAAYLEENKSIAEIIAMGFAPEVVRDVVRRVKINEYKRKQAPIGLKVTSKAFGYGRRYPNAERYQEGS